jgi:putative flippase GtrA
LKNLAFQYTRFVIVSGMGLILAVGLLWVGTHLAGLPVWLANAIGDCVAVSFVFIMSERSIFSGTGHYLLAKYGAWIVWQVAHISAISVVLEWLVRHGAGHLMAPLAQAPETTFKLLITPVTVSLNFIAARFLLHRPIRPTQ